MRKKSSIQRDSHQLPCPPGHTLLLFLEKEEDKRTVNVFGQRSKIVNILAAGLVQHLASCTALGALPGPMTLAVLSPIRGRIVLERHRQSSSGVLLWLAVQGHPVN